MKKLFALLFAASVLVAGCKVLQSATNTVCSVSATVCPVVTNLLSAGASVDISPSSKVGQVLVSASGISTILCDAIGGICPVVDSALAHGQSVTLMPITHSATSSINSKEYNTINVKVAIHKK